MAVEALPARRPDVIVDDTNLRDRQQVVRMWREPGLTVFQVADGDF